MLVLRGQAMRELQFSCMSDTRESTISATVKDGGWHCQVVGVGLEGAYGQWDGFVSLAAGLAYGESSWCFLIALGEALSAMYHGFSD
jgi:hypothetical protein